MAQHSNLPDELIGAIVQRLCLSCTPREEDPSCSCEDTNQRDRGRVAALAALCQTSRQLNSLATVHLYHHPLCTRRAAVLAQTLVARKDLARHVKHLCLGDTFWDALSRRAEARNVQVDTVTSLCPNLESLHATLDYHEALQYMEETGSITTLPQLGVDWTTTLSLLRAAPNLTTLTLTLISACSDLSDLGGGGDKTLPNLTTLAFQFSTLSAASLITALRACPNLETFKYHMGGPLVGAEQFALPEAEHALLAHAPKLKFVRLHPNWGPQRPMFEDEWRFADRDQLERALARRGVKFEWRS
ncbi:hypothetical protein C8A01DRAFT_13605 [Parachaetomium inaequale]|uniref:Uncharacterized protein n=1 Tax=Parachaetomium inaequale TaxID=2588326 RepID=A0AAN6PKW0_9PEZI|nr:hypothetical protein C8A01DRAFT_13605 [Parachaetomium inaequale]